MNKEIHHTCRCLNRNFTYDEWRDYVNEHEYNSDEIVHAFNGFEYNIHDVCLNPKNVIDISNGPYLRVIITVCQSDNGRWDYGINSTFWNSGAGSPCTFVDNIENGYSTERGSVYEGIKYAKNAIIKDIENIRIKIDRYDEFEDKYDLSSSGKTYRQRLENNVLKLIDGCLEKYDPRVLLLFD